MKTKVCTKCKQEKSLGDFSLDKLHRDGRHSQCKNCMAEYSRQYYRSHGELCREKRRKWQQRNPGYRKRYYRENTKLYRKHNLKRRGLTPNDYERIFARQNGCCAICNRPETYLLYGKIKRLAVDHDHKTGEIRGLLCTSCNILLGWLEKIEKTGFVNKANIYRRKQE